MPQLEEDGWSNGLSLPGSLMDSKEAVDSLLSKLETQICCEDDLSVKKDNDEEPLIEATVNNNIDDVNKLLAFPETDIMVKDKDKEWTAAEHAAYWGYNEILQVLLNHISKIENEYAGKILMISVAEGYLECVRLILDMGFHPDCGFDGEGRSALQNSIEHKEMEIFELLLERGADINHRCSQGKVSIHYAATRRLPDYVVALLWRGADVNSKDTAGKTPLHHAVSKASIKTTVELISCGADLWTKDQSGQRPIDDIPKKTLEAYLNSCIYLEDKMENEEPTAIIKYDILNPSPDKPEWKRLSFFIKSPKHRNNLTHPVLHTFICLKWKRILPLFCLNFAIYFAYVICSSMYAISFVPGHDKNDSNTTNTDVDDHDPDDTLHLIVKVFLYMLISREGFQIISSGYHYFTHVENYMEACIILLASVAVFMDNVPLSVKRSCATLWPLFTWIELAFLIGRFPSFTQYIFMFTTVSKNYLKFLFPFVFILCGFVVSFYLTFNFCNDKAVGDCNKLYNFFPMAGLKTTLMMMGEMDLQEFPYGALLPSTFILVILFIFLIMLVLMNLLDALAVSDIQKIADEAELHGLLPCVNLVCYVESILWTSSSVDMMSRKLPKCCSCLCDNIVTRAVFKLFRKIPEYLLVLPSMPEEGVTLNLVTGAVSSTFFRIPEHLLDDILQFLKDTEEEEEYEKFSEQFKELTADVNSLEDNMRKLNGEVQKDVLVIKNKVELIDDRMEKLSEQVGRILEILGSSPSPVSQPV